MPDRFDWTAKAAVAAADLARWAVLPVIPTWSRLEPLPLTTGDLLPGAQALVADPLWLIGRQWQFDELRGEDAGTPIRATVRGERAPFGRFLAGLADGDEPAARAIDLPPGGLPLEARVEAELPAVLPLRLRTQTGLHLQRLLRAGGHATVADAMVAAFAVRPDVDEGDDAGAARARLAAGRVPDGAAVLAALAPLDDGVGGLTGLPEPLAVAAGDEAAVRAVLADWRTWVRNLLVEPTDAWNPGRLEHAFAVQARFSDGPVVMRADEYTGGSLDWFHGDLAAGPDLGGAPPGDTAFADTTLPTPVRFPGMPSDRLFAFEDAAVYLGGIQGGRTDLARLAVVEFALAYSVDWFLVPLVVPYGHAVRLDGLHVVDTFGVEVEVGPAREVTSPGWTVFQSTPATDGSRLADVFVLAPTAPGVVEGDPLEEVALFRDEMANLVWGVERIVPGRRSGEPVHRARSAARVSLRQTIPDDLGDAQIIYRLMTPVPENWLPFVAFRERPADLRAHHVLERRPMLRYLDDGTAELVNPQGTVLLGSPDADPATDRLRIAEEEVPRDGVVVTRSFQLARTEDGDTVMWVGRRVRTGRGEGASGLRFDTALPPGSV